MIRLRPKLRYNVGAVDRMAMAGARQAVGQAALLVVNIAKRRLSDGSRVPSAPGDSPALVTGNLRASTMQEEVAPAEFVVGFSRAGWYGAIHEEGGRNHPPRPTLMPAMDEAVDHFPWLWSRVGFDYRGR